jgi:hypothetical protein
MHSILITKIIDFLEISLIIIWIIFIFGLLKILFFDNK